MGSSFGAITFVCEILETDEQSSGIVVGTPVKSETVCYNCTSMSMTACILTVYDIPIVIPGMQATTVLHVQILVREGDVRRHRGQSCRNATMMYEADNQELEIADHL
jgi:hypothetical protein